MADNVLAALDQRQLKLRLDEAKHQMAVAATVGFLMGGVGLLLLLWIAYDTEEWRATAPYFLGHGFTLWAAWGTRQRNEFAAGALAVVTVANALIQWFIYGRLGGVVMTALGIYAVVRGFLAAMDYGELQKERAARELVAEERGW